MSVGEMRKTIGEPEMGRNDMMEETPTAIHAS
jgi:hypothetical protein